MELNASVNLETKKSEKTGNDYQVLIIKFVGGYNLSVFLNNEQLYILNNLLK